MPQVPQWPRAKMRELLALAECKGEAKAALDSPRDAELFRFALYDFRKQEHLGRDLVITIDDSTVVVTKRERPNVRIEEEAAP